MGGSISSNSTIQRKPVAATAPLTPQKASENAENSKNVMLPLHPVHPVKLSNTTQNPGIVLKLASDNFHLEQALSTHNKLSTVCKEIYNSKETARNAWKNNRRFNGLMTRLREYFNRRRLRKDMVTYYQQEKWQLKRFQEDIVVHKRLAQAKLVELKPVSVSDKTKSDKTNLELQAISLLTNLQIGQQCDELESRIRYLKTIDGYINKLLEEINNKEIQEIDAQALQKQMDIMLSYLYSVELKYAENFNKLAGILQERLTQLSNLSDEDLPGTSVTMLLNGALEQLATEDELLQDNKTEMADKLKTLTELQQELEHITEKYRKVTLQIDSTEGEIGKQHEALKSFRDAKNKLNQLFDNEKGENDKALQPETVQQVEKDGAKKFAAKVYGVIVNQKPDNSEGSLENFDKIQAAMQKILQGSSKEVLATLNAFFQQKKAMLTKSLVEMKKGVTPDEIKKFLLFQYISVVEGIGPEMSPALQHWEKELKDGLRELEEKKAQKLQERETVINSGQSPLERLKEVLPSAVSTDAHGRVHVKNPTLNKAIGESKTAVEEIKRQSDKLRVLKTGITKAYQSAGAAVPAG